MIRKTEAIICLAFFFSLFAACGAAPQLRLYAQGDFEKSGEEKISDEDTPVSVPGAYTVFFRKIEISIDGRNWRVIFSGERDLNIINRQALLTKTVTLEQATYYYVKLTLGRIDGYVDLDGKRYEATYTGLAGVERVFSIQQGDFEPMVLTPGTEKTLVFFIELKDTIGYDKKNDKINLYRPELSVRSE